ncbi:Hypothetical protein CINCED_3A006062 [Cinara cedri]|uniref:Uncharacterized protein n=1 Tax=Cinara cedri TaxID=506608 RepID=A0A5E4M1F6_9HEMI|nr:Hypothetical protein CINCED_3A006062 [Cinara cedri]
MNGLSSNSGAHADCGQKSLERGGRGSADAGSPWAQRYRGDFVPQEKADCQLHGSGHFAFNPVGDRLGLSAFCCL